jgi:hypothetical protein
MEQGGCGALFAGWFTRPELNIYRAIPFLVLWGTWLSCNNILFVEKEMPYFQVFSQLVAIFNQVKESSNPKLPLED